MSESNKLITLKTLFDDIKSMKERPDWNEYFMLVAYLISKRSTCQKLHVGCVLVRENRIASSGYNGHLAATPHESFIRDGHEQMTIHAETNAICNLTKYKVPINDIVCYVTHFPCLNCAKTLIASGIKEIMYAEDYNNDPVVDKLASSAGVKISKFTIK